MSSPRRLMAVLAHPDDESLGVGGTLAKYAGEGVDVFLVTATRGDGGRFGGHRSGDGRHPGALALGNIRETELRAAAAVLGVREVSLLDYHDQHLDRADPREAVGRITAHLRKTFHVAGDRSDNPDCQCSYPYSELIVTPSFVREYCNVHLLTIWRETLFALAFADEWVFIGYSLPPDDVGIRALLLRARCIREGVQQDPARKLPTVVGPSSLLTAPEDGDSQADELCLHWTA